MNLEIAHLSCGYADKCIIHDVSLKIMEGEVICLLGANGSGKTTLIKALLGVIPTDQGIIRIDGCNISNWSSRRIARVMGYIPQAHTPPFPFKVLDVVLMGRTAHMHPFASPSSRDYEIARQAIETMNIAHLEDKAYTEISGGERQLVLIARALAQEPDVLIMDEPTSNLDFGNQIRVLSHIQRLSYMNIAVLMSCHFPEHAFLYATRVVLLDEGRMLYSGNPAEVITEESLKTLYGVDIEVITVSNRMNQELQVCVPARRVSA